MNVNTHTLQDCQFCGADGFSTKPFTALKLNAEIMRLRKSGRLKTPPTRTATTASTIATADNVLLPVVLASAVHAHSSGSDDSNSSATQQHVASVSQQLHAANTDTAMAVTVDTTNITDVSDCQP
jgi:hypothetical protein